MPATTTSYVKNIIRRGLREIVDPSPDRNDVERVWSFFESKCAYCGRQLQRGRKEGHIDHLVSAAQGGANHVSNRVLSCATCNEKEKLDAPWEIFLERKVKDAALRRTRSAKIREWRRVAKSVQSVATSEQLAVADKVASEVVALFDAAVAKIRGVRHLTVRSTGTRARAERAG